MTPCAATTVENFKKHLGTLQRCILLLHHYKRLNNMRGTVEPRITEPLHYEVLGIIVKYFK